MWFGKFSYGRGFGKWDSPCGCCRLHHDSRIRARPFQITEISETVRNFGSSCRTCKSPVQGVSTVAVDTPTPRQPAPKSWPVDSARANCHKSTDCLSHSWHDIQLDWKHPRRYPVLDQSAYTADDDFLEPTTFRHLQCREVRDLIRIGHGDVAGIFLLGECRRVKLGHLSFPHLLIWICSTRLSYVQGFAKDDNRLLLSDAYQTTRLGGIPWCSPLAVGANIVLFPHQKYWHYQRIPYNWRQITHRASCSH